MAVLFMPSLPAGSSVATILAWQFLSEATEAFGAAEDAHGAELASTFGSRANEAYWNGEARYLPTFPPLQAARAAWHAATVAYSDAVDEDRAAAGTLADFAIA